MTTTYDLLIEIGTEELPPKSLRRLSEAFSGGVLEGLAKAQLTHGGATSFASPRRLAILVPGLDERQADREVERRGPALTAAFDDQGNLTRAAQGFARSCGVEAEQLQRLETDKGAWLVHRFREEGRPTAELIPAIVQAALDGLPIPKRMRWGSLDAEFVRPVHWVVLLFGEKVIEAEILCVKAGRETRGHRFHHPEPIFIGEPAAYAPLLETEGRVIADFAARREAIRGQVMEAADRLGGKAVLDEELLEEVTALVEWPVVVTGSFEERFLAVPGEALISAMKGHQKYFPVVSPEGALLPHFIAISNIDSRAPEQVRHGNERVIRPRLADAEFFWDTDRKQPLQARLETLKGVVFQDRLGSLHDKSERIAGLAEAVAKGFGADAALAGRAAWLTKCDLLTEMVGEFPELQGIMGRYYALRDGEPAEVAQAIDEQYMPRFAGDELPGTATGQAVALADRVDTLVGIFGIDQRPTGAKDPFGLRRAALGVLRVLIERELDLDLRALLATARAQFENQGHKLAVDVEGQVFDFVMERLRAYYGDRGIAHDTFEAVLARQPVRPRDFDLRIRAVSAFRELPEAESLAAANKRIHNILRQAEGEVPESVDPARLVEPQEKALAEQIDKLAGQVGPLFEQRAYADALCALAALREPVDAFFDAVMVMAEEPALRANRLALLKRLNGLFLGAADLSCLQS